jgi:hypothetical protein
MEDQVLAAGNKQMAARMAALRSCVATYLVKTAGSRSEVSTQVESAFVSCATEEASLRDFALSRARNPSEIASALSDYRAAFKQDMVRRLVAAGG